MKIGDVLGALIALITVSCCVIKLYDLYKFVDDLNEDEQDEDSD